MPSDTVYRTVPSLPGRSSAVEPRTRRMFCPTTSTLSEAPRTVSGMASPSSNTRPAGLETAVKTSTLVSALGRTKTVTGAVVSACASALTTEMRTSDTTSLTSSAIVTLTV